MDLKKKNKTISQFPVEEWSHKKLTKYEWAIYILAALCLSSIYLIVLFKI